MKIEIGGVVGIRPAIRSHYTRGVVLATHGHKSVLAIYSVSGDLLLDGGGYPVPHSVDNSDLTPLLPQPVVEDD